jgi:dTDP-4-dehydrorhamnose 3,5-epimerase
MMFQELALQGAYLIEPERQEDSRGFFARTWCRREFEALGLEVRLEQCSVSFNTLRNTIRGMHYQAAPHGEVKLVRCTRGAVFDVIVDLRPASPTFGKWASAGLDESNRRALYIPAGFAHGFQTLADGTEVFYQMCGTFEPSAARGVRWDDPAFAIDWPPADSRVISDRDRAYPDFRSDERDGAS